jgi:hypothetical protein
MGAGTKQSCTVSLDPRETVRLADCGQKHCPSASAAAFGPPVNGDVFSLH